VTDDRWRQAGRIAAWVYAGAALVGGVLVTVVSIGIPSTDDLDRHYSYIRSIWPELYISFLLLMVAFISLVPLAVVLREKFGHGLRSELVYASFLAAAIVGLLWMLSQIGSAQAVARESANLSGADLKSMAAASGIWSGVINWLQRGFILFAGLGTWWTGRLALEQRSLPRGLVWISVALSGLYFLGLLNLVLFDFGVAAANSIGSLIVALGAVTAFVWAAWLGWELGRTSD
jgi:hypothetical protein